MRVTTSAEPDVRHAHGREHPDPQDLKNTRAGQCASVGRGCSHLTIDSAGREHPITDALDLAPPDGARQRASREAECLQMGAAGESAEARDGVGG